MQTTSSLVKNIYFKSLFSGKPFLFYFYFHKRDLMVVLISNSLPVLVDVAFVSQIFLTLRDTPAQQPCVLSTRIQKHVVTLIEYTVCFRRQIEIVSSPPISISNTRLLLFNICYCNTIIKLFSYYCICCCCYVQFIHLFYLPNIERQQNVNVLLSWCFPPLMGALL